MSFVLRVMRYVYRHGVRFATRFATEKVREKLSRSYNSVWHQLQPKTKELDMQKKDCAVQEVGLISVVIPVYNTKPVLLNALADSLVNQSYQNWEACLYDGASTSPQTRLALDALSRRDKRIHVMHGEINEGISGNSNQAIKMAHGEWIALCDHDDMLTADALYCVAKTILEQQPDIIFSDEDKTNEAGTYFYEPNYKPDFCPDDLRSGNYICHLTVIRKKILQDVGGFRKEFDGSQDHDLMLRCTEATKRIAHIPKVLYHWRTVGASMSHQHIDRCMNAAKHAVEEHMKRMNIKGNIAIDRGYLHIRYDTNPKQRLELIAIDDGNSQNWSACTKRMKGWRAHHMHRTVISTREENREDIDCCFIPWENGKSVYACINKAVKQSTADVIVILHSAVMMDWDDQWLEEMLMYAQRDDVGAVTPLLVDRNGLTVSAGIAVGMDHLVSSYGSGVLAIGPCWRHRMLGIVHNVTAVSCTCTMIRRDHFIPFDENYQEGLGTVDWSLRLAQKGLVHVYTPFAKGKVEDKKCANCLLMHRAPNKADTALYKATWGMNVHDISYSANFSRKKADYKLPRRFHLRRE